MINCVTIILNNESKEFYTLACRAIRTSQFEWPANWPEAKAEEFIHFIQAQGVLLLFGGYLQRVEECWPKSVYQAISIANVAGANLLQIRKKTIQTLFEILAYRQIKAVLFKGAANAYLLYPKPIYRQHADIDILFDVKDYSVVVEILAQMGFNIDAIEPTKFGPYQTTATLQQSGKPAVLIDIHWKINNRLLLAEKLNIDEIWADILPIKDYGERVFGLGYQNALLAACIHEAGSLPVERGRLIGLYDACLLVKKLGKQDLLKVLERSREKGIGKICLEYIKKAVEIFGTRQEILMFTELESDFGEIAFEPSSRLMKDHRSWVEDQRLDWLAVDGVNNKIEYIISKFSHKFLSH